MIITSTQNPRVKALAALRRRQERERSGSVLVEGYEEVSLALTSGARPLELYYCPALIGNAEQLSLVEAVRAGGTEVVELSRQVFEKVAYRQNPDGWLAVFSPPPTSLAALRVGADALVLVCEAVEKPGNLGAMLRTADAAGADALIAVAPVIDWGNPNLVRASRGCLFSVPVAEAAPEAAIQWLRARGIAVVAAAPDAGMPPTAADLRRPVALAVGSEKHGLSGAWLQEADARVRIPMFGRVNSLNVAASAAILLYEALRQRGKLRL